MVCRRHRCGEPDAGPEVLARPRGTGCDAARAYRSRYKHRQVGGPCLAQERTQALRLSTPVVVLHSASLCAGLAGVVAVMLHRTYIRDAVGNGAFLMYSTTWSTSTSDGAHSTTLRLQHDSGLEAIVVRAQVLAGDMPLPVAVEPGMWLYVHMQLAEQHYCGPWHRIDADYLPVALSPDDVLEQLTEQLVREIADALT